MSDDSNPCISCGACCARFRISFYSEDSNVPQEYSYSTGLLERTMKTRTSTQGLHRCVALQGEIGTSVACGIYENRPQPCRNFRYSYEGGGPREERCDQARAAIGLAPLQPPRKLNIDL